MRKYYFPPSGFGFWYQLGILSKLDEDSVIYGSSSGSLICLIYLLDKKYKNFDYLSCLANKIKNEIGYNYNLYVYVHKFVLKIISILYSQDIRKTMKRMKNIYIQYSKFSYIGFRLKIETVFKNPINFDNLYHLIQASCYIPILSRHRSLLYYEIDNELAIDGFFSNLSNVSNELIKINSYDYIHIIPCSKKKAKLWYNEGINYKFTNNKQFSFIILIKVICINILEIIKLLYDNMTNLLIKTK